MWLSERKKQRAYGLDIFVLHKSDTQIIKTYYTKTPKKHCLLRKMTNIQQRKVEKKLCLTLTCDINIKDLKAVYCPVLWIKQLEETQQ